MDFDCNHLSDLDGCLRIGNAHPANVKGRPSLESQLCRVKHSLPLPKQGTRHVVSETGRQPVVV